MVSSCHDLGLEVSSQGAQVHDRPWSRALVHDLQEIGGAGGYINPSGAHTSPSVPTRVWFKANGIGTRHEPELISALASLVPDLVPEVLAIDAERGWSLTRDAGPTWRSSVPDSEQWPLWEDLMQRYAVAQLELAAHRDDLLATGVQERSPATLPTLTADLVARLTVLGAEHGQSVDDCGGLSVADSEALTARLPAYGQWCSELDEAGIPMTIQHDDLHSANICCAQGSRVRLGRPSATSRIIDWGDASIGHPFGTMLTTLGSIADHFGCDGDDPRVRRVRDAYLEPFTTHAPHSELTALVVIARQVSVVTRALSWRAALIGSPTSVHREYAFPVRGWLKELLAEPPEP